MLGFIAVGIGVKFASKETVYIEFDANSVSGFAGDACGFIEAELHEVLCLALASGFPKLIKPREFVAPSFESFEWRKVRISGEKFSGGDIRSGDEVAEAGCEFFGERLLGALWPDLARLREGAEFTDRGA